MRIVVLDGYTLNPGDNPWDEVAALGSFEVYDRTERADILTRAQNAEILLTNKTPLSADTLAQLPQLRFINVLATGYNVVDVAAARARGIAVSNVPAYSTDSVAQFVFALLLELCHHVGRHDQAVKSGRWSEAPDFCFWDTPLIELAGKTMGIIGFGQIGMRTGQLAHAFEMKVIATKSRKNTSAPYPVEWATPNQVFEQADVISLHAPLTHATTRLVNREALKRMKPTAFLINTARGPLVDEAALAEALNSGRLAGAACDVVSIEPIWNDNPLLTAKNIILTPHIAWATLAARKRCMQITAQNVAAFLAGKPVNVVN